MALKRKVNGKWVSIAGPSTNSNNSKAVNVSLTDFAELYDTSNVEGALAEIGFKVKDINTAVNKVTTDFNEYKNNNPGGSGGGGATLPTIPASLPANGGNADTVNHFHIWQGTQAEYDSISSKNANTIYLIKEG